MVLLDQKLVLYLKQQCRSVDSGVRSENTYMYHTGGHVLHI